MIEVEEIAQKHPQKDNDTTSNSNTPSGLSLQSPGWVYKYNCLHHLQEPLQ